MVAFNISEFNHWFSSGTLPDRLRSGRFYLSERFCERFLEKRLAIHRQLWYLVSFHETRLFLNNKKQMMITLAEFVYRWMYSPERIAVLLWNYIIQYFFLESTNISEDQKCKNSPEKTSEVMDFNNLLWKGILRIKDFLILLWGRQRHWNLFYPDHNNWEYKTHIFNFKYLRLYTKFVLHNIYAIIYKIQQQIPVRTHFIIHVLQLVTWFSIFL